MTFNFCTKLYLRNFTKAIKKRKKTTDSIATKDVASIVIFIK